MGAPPAASLEHAVDVLVAGGGPAGLASALALRRLGLDVLVAESGDYGGTRAADTLRPEGKRALGALGVPEDAFAGCRVEGRGIVAAWDTAEPVEEDFFLHPDGPAWHLDRPAFDRVLARSAGRAGARVLCNARLVDFAHAGGVWRVTVEAGSDRLDVEARYLIDATGRSGRIARELGAGRFTYDRQVALWATFEPSAAATTGSKLVLEAAAGGWWYSIPIPGERVLAAYVTDGDLAPPTSAEAWAAALDDTRHTAARLDRRPRIDGPRIRPAGVGRLAESAGPGWLAVGDAAATLEPLSGFGLAAALIDGRRAAATVSADAAGDDAAFARYSEQTTRAFEAHLADRARTFGRADRDFDHVFWRRRRPVDVAREPITLDPMLRLTRSAKAPVTAGTRLEGLMSRQDIARMRALCAEPKEAHCILGEFRGAAGAALDDRGMIVALQIMLEDRLLEAAGYR